MIRIVSYAGLMGKVGSYKDKTINAISHFHEVHYPMQSKLVPRIQNLEEAALSFYQIWTFCCFGGKIGDEGGRNNRSLLIPRLRVVHVSFQSVCHLTFQFPFRLYCMKFQNLDLGSIFLLYEWVQ